MTLIIQNTINGTLRQEKNKINRNFLLKKGLILCYIYDLPLHQNKIKIHMRLLPSKEEDLTSIMSIIHDAQVYLAYQNIDQWQDAYPNEKVILADISKQNSFVVKNEEGFVLATTMFTTRPEPTYTNIDGNWLTAKNAIYGVIHRMAVGRKYRKQGIAKFILNQCEQKLLENQVSSMRIDTHEDNKGMQNLLKKSGYVYCGVIILGSGAKRLAFEKLIN